MHYYQSSWLIFVLVSLVKLLFLPFYRSTDFEVHRNWLAITHSLPLQQWYYENTSEWTLDYPPFFAYFEFLLSMFARFFDMRMLEVNNLKYASEATIIFQRLSVVVTDLVLFLAIQHFCQGMKRTDYHETGEGNDAAWRWRRKQFIVTLLTFAHPGLLLVDHVHFQYNGFLLGLLVLSISYLQRGQDLYGGIVFAVLLNFKHIFIYAAPVYFVYLLRHYCFEEEQIEFETWEQFRKKRIQTRSFRPFRFLILGGSVTSVFVISFLPFISHLPQVFSRLFPFGQRGLCHAYWAPNVWVFYNLMDKLLTRFLLPFFSNCASSSSSSPAAHMTGGLVEDAGFQCLPSITPKITLLLTLCTMLPALAVLFLRPHTKLFMSTLVYCLLCSFMCGWHVHEKAVLMVLIPLSLCTLESLSEARISVFLSIIGTVSLFPLLYQPTEFVLKILLLLFHSGLSYFLLTTEWQEIQELRRIRYIGLLSKFQQFYLSLIVPLLICVHIVCPFFLPKFEFLPLLMMSLYCAVGTVHGWWLCMKSVCHAHRVLKADENS